jgi:hypothetical protein
VEVDNDARDAIVVTAWIAIVISFLSLGVSSATAWLILFRRGNLKMTQPTVIFFGPDGARAGIIDRD